MCLQFTNHWKPPIFTVYWMPGLSAPASLPFSPDDAVAPSPAMLRLPGLAGIPISAV